MTVSDKGGLFFVAVVGRFFAAAGAGFAGTIGVEAAAFEKNFFCKDIA